MGRLYSVRSETVLVKSSSWMLFTGCCANGKVAAGSLAASINLYFLCRNAALEPKEREAPDPAGFVWMLFC